MRKISASKSAVNPKPQRHSDKEAIKRAARKLRQQACELLTRFGYVQRLGGTWSLPKKSKARQRAEAMGVMEKTFTVTEKSFLRQAGRGFWVGGEFMDHGRKMKIVAIGEVRVDGNERLIDVTAVPASEPSR
jgi:hypothetical protein